MEKTIRKLFISLVILSALTAEGVSIPALWRYVGFQGSEQTDAAPVIRRDTGGVSEGAWQVKRTFSGVLRKYQPDQNRSGSGKGTFAAAGPSFRLDFFSGCRSLQPFGVKSSLRNRQVTVYQADSSPPADQGLKAAEYRI